MGARGEREHGEQEGSEREQGEQEGSEGGKREQGEQEGVRGSEGNEMNVMLRFEGPHHQWQKKLHMMTYSVYVPPPPGSTVPTQCPFT